MACGFADTRDLAQDENHTRNKRSVLVKRVGGDVVGSEFAEIEEARERLKDDLGPFVW